MEDLWGYISELGKPIVKKVYADWMVINREVSFQLVQFGFELVHIPHKNGQKNSADILMTTDAVLLLTQFPWIQHFVFITNDRDFRGLFQALSKHNKRITLICQQKRVSTELLQLADVVKDYQEFSGISGSELSSEEIAEPQPSMSKEKAQELLLDKLVEAIEFLREIRHAANDFSPFTQGDILVRLKMVYPDYEQAVNVLVKGGVFQKKKWFSNLLHLAEEKRIIRLELYGATYHISMAASVPTRTAKLREEYFNSVLNAIRNHGEGDKIDLSKLASVLGSGNKKRLRYQDLGYNQFKNALLDMQYRKLVQLKRKQNTNAWEVIRLV